MTKRQVLLKNLLEERFGLKTSQDIAVKGRLSKEAINPYCDLVQTLIELQNVTHLKTQKLIDRLDEVVAEQGD